MKKLFPVFWCFLLILCGCSSSPSLESITISCDKSELDINETAHITIQVLPENANVYALFIDGGHRYFSLSSDGESISSSYPKLYSLNVDATAVLEGTSEIYVVANGNIESNKLTFDIVDKEKQAEEARRLEKQKQQAPILAKKSEIKNAIDEILKNNFTTEKYYIYVFGADEDNSNFLPKISFSHYFADVDFSSKIVNDIIDTLYIQDTFENIGETTISFETPHSVDSPDCYEIKIDPITHVATYVDWRRNDITSQILQAEADSSEPEESSELQPTVSVPETVWISDKGNKYHSNASCSNMTSPYQVTIEEAEAMGRTPCKKCY